MQVRPPLTTHLNLKAVQAAQLHKPLQLFAAVLERCAKRNNLLTCGVDQECRCSYSTF